MVFDRLGPEMKAEMAYMVLCVIQEEMTTQIETKVVIAL